MLRVLRRLLGWLRPYRRQLVGAYLCLLLSTLLSLALPKLLGEAIDQGLSRGSPSLLLALALAIVAVALLRGLASLGQSYLAERVSQGVAYDLRNALYDKIQHLSFGYHDRAQTGQLMSRATQDVEQVQWWVGFGLIRVGQMVVLLVGTAVLLSLINWKLALVGLTLLPLISYRAVAASPRLRHLWDRVQDKLGELSTVLQENLMGMRVVKAFNRERYEEEKFARKATEVYTAGLDAAKVYNFHVPFMSFLIMTATG
ncbi:MAG: ABC transporter ATP-binding protein, partial [Dehalococcoidia bacterium]|nr:ABC transporter ATP-binding protein [Dehalococcoidia bacterium]